LDQDCKPIKNYSLGDQATVEAAINKVANQAKKKE
jgi:hypothetical protein